MRTLDVVNACVCLRNTSPTVQIQSLRRLTIPIVGSRDQLLDSTPRPRLRLCHLDRVKTLSHIGRSKVTTATWIEAPLWQPNSNETCEQMPPLPRESQYNLHIKTKRGRESHIYHLPRKTRPKTRTVELPT